MTLTTAISLRTKNLSVEKTLSPIFTNRGACVSLNGQKTPETGSTTQSKESMTSKNDGKRHLSLRE